MIKTKAFDIQSIALLGVFSSIWVIFMIIGFFCDDNIVLRNIIIYTSGSITLLCLLAQVLIYRKKNLTISFDYKGIKIINMNYEIPWESITGLYYQNLWFVCFPNELEIFFNTDNTTKIFSELYGVNVHIFKRKYKKLLKIIPKEYLNKNEFLIYENIDLKKKDKYKIYK